jgi:hypothetical protein
MRAKLLTALLSVGLLLLVTAHPAAQAPAERKLQLSFDKNGLVTLIAQNVTVREILAEWTRLGGTQMVNADKLTGAPVSVVFEAQPEGVVLESLLRSTAGYILYPRLEGSPGASVWQSVSILPTSHPTTSYTPTSSAPQIAPVVQTLPDDELPPVTVVPNSPAQTQPAPSPTANRPAVPGPGVYVPMQTSQPGMGGAPPATGTGAGSGTGAGTTTTTTTGRGRGGGGL